MPGPCITSHDYSTLIFHRCPADRIRRGNLNLPSSNLQHISIQEFPYLRHYTQLSRVQL
ncbi:hypothetical protein K449DRAFT_384736 [Hypoxylon sp. EC38]|nr:hypothetical protein K449DRAFT_384736 [Hypoxylon sp. EC38]